MSRAPNSGIVWEGPRKSGRGLEGASEVQEGSGGLPAIPGGVGKAPRKFVRGQEEPPKVREGLGGHP